MLTENAKVLNNRPLTNDYRVLRLKSPQISSHVRPGQFVHLRVPRLEDAVLRRPFSVFKADNSTVSLLFKTVGKGTRAMAHLRPGDSVSLLGPLGNGFPDVRHDRLPALVAGGYGMAALYLLAQRAPVQGHVFVGGASAKDILCAADFRKIGWKVHVATEDGTMGEKGLVTTMFNAWLRKDQTKQKLALFACGPMGMLKAVADRAQAGGWTAWLSLDNHMGCGLGACLACVQKVRIHGTSSPSASKTEKNTEWKWARICTEGPVFECREILWE
jgi:dihydroorotate dehydrogenase electron transfer subunit